MHFAPLIQITLNPEATKIQSAGAVALHAPLVANQKQGFRNQKRGVSLFRRFQSQIILYLRILLFVLFTPE